MKRRLLLFSILIFLDLSCEAAPTVGIEERLEVQLPGTLLTAKPPERSDKIIVRIADTRPHGTLIHYDLRYIGLVPGEYDLRPLLSRADGSSTADLPALKVQIAPLLPPEHQGQLNLRTPGLIAALGGYKTMMIGIAVLWVVAAIPLLRKRRVTTVAASNEPAPPTLADRLRPLVERAAAGQLPADGQAELERLLLGHWQRRLGLESVAPAEAIRKLREHPEAGSLLRALEDWLHRRPGTARVDLDAVLAPYARLGDTPDLKPA